MPKNVIKVAKDRLITNAILKAKGDLFSKNKLVKLIEKNIENEDIRLLAINNLNTNLRDSLTVLGFSLEVNKLRNRSN